MKALAVIWLCIALFSPIPAAALSFVTPSGAVVDETGRMISPPTWTVSIPTTTPQISFTVKRKGALIALPSCVGKRGVFGVATCAPRI